jgi:hypothetical protein
LCDLLPPAVFSRTTSPVKAASIEYVVHLELPSELMLDVLVVLA